MADRAHIPNSPACGQWETLLADALDGLLRPGEEATFSAHMAVCPACTVLFEEARRGREWLEFLSPEPAIPEGLLDKILASTGPGQVAGYGLVTAGSIPQGAPAVPAAWQRQGLAGPIRRFAEPRLMMTAAMAFFSIALTLNLAGVRITELRLANLRPSAVRSFMERQLTAASTPIVRYYDHLRLVYEVQARMRELRRSGETMDGGRPSRNGPAPGQSERQPGKDGGSQIRTPQESVAPADAASEDYSEASLTLEVRPGGKIKDGTIKNKNGSIKGGLEPARTTLGRLRVALQDRQGRRSTRWTA